MGLLHRMELSRNTIEIDDVVLIKPNYVGWDEWSRFWREVIDLNEDFGLGEYDPGLADD
jgi:hypothetical protein